MEAGTMTRMRPAGGQQAGRLAGGGELVRERAVKEEKGEGLCGLSREGTLREDECGTERVVWIGLRPRCRG